MSARSCPNCHTELSDGDYSRVIGVEIEGVYDGILFWQCLDCGHRWHRFAPTAGRLYSEASVYMNRDDEVAS